MRNLDPNLSANLAGQFISPLFLVELAFKSQTLYVWSGVGSIVYGGNTYLGVGTLGKIGTITEGTAIQADGTTLTLSGIDPTIAGECLSDIQTMGGTKIWFGTMVQGTIVGVPYLLYSGTVDVPTFDIGVETMSITLTLENKMLDLQRPRMRRYTSADQRLLYPTDIGFSWVESLNDLNLRFGN